MPFSEQDSETSTWRSKSRSEEMLQALGTVSSMDPFMMEGEKYCTDVVFCIAQMLYFITCIRKCRIENLFIRYRK